MSETPRVLRAHGTHYTVERVLVSHPDYDTLLLATREAWHGGARKLVILKPVPAGLEGQARAREEVLLARYLRHPNIARVEDWLPGEDMAYVVMEHIRGCTVLSLLHAALLAGRRIPPELAAYVASEVAHALDYAHTRLDEEGHALRIVHRAVSPLRIFLERNGRIKLTHFGAAWSELRERLPTPPTLLRGDAAYVAPEVLQGFLQPRPPGVDPLTPRHFDRRADIFSLGLVLLEMLTLCHALDAPDVWWRELPAPFPADIRTERPTWLELPALANRVLHFGPEQVAQVAGHVPAPLQQIVSRALRSEPSERYQTAGAMRDELRAYVRSVVGHLSARQVAWECKRIIQQARARPPAAAYSTVERGLLPVPRDLKA